MTTTRREIPIAGKPGKATRSPGTWKRALQCIQWNCPTTGQISGPKNRIEEVRWAKIDIDTSGNLIGSGSWICGFAFCLRHSWDGSEVKVPVVH